MSTTHATGSREEWLTARLALLDAEKDLTHRSDEVARQHLELPWVRQLGRRADLETRRTQW